MEDVEIDDKKRNIEIKSEISEDGSIITVFCTLHDRFWQSKMKTNLMKKILGKPNFHVN